MYSYRKKVLDPLTFYNVYIRNYNKYFNDIHIPNRKRELNNKKIESYLINFSETHFIKLKESLNLFDEFILWCFSKYGRVTIFNLHTYIEEFLKRDKQQLTSFYFNVIKYIKKNKITWDEYVKGTKNRFPKILEHYSSTTEIPFELIVYLNVLDIITEQQKKMIKIILRKDFIGIDKTIKKVKANEHFFECELQEIKKGLNNE